MNILLTFATGLTLLAVVPAPASAQGIPADCMASFNVKGQNVTVDISWTLAAGKSAALSCGAAEALRTNLFIQGDKTLNEGDFIGTPATAQHRAVTALNDLESNVQHFPGKDVPGALFSAGGYLVSKYLLASCLLTVEAAGGTCWGAAATFIGATYRFFQKIYTDEKNTIAKQDLISEIKKIKLALTAVKPGQADQAGTRARWIQTQTNLCRAIQRDCL